MFFWGKSMLHGMGRHCRVRKIVNPGRSRSMAIILLLFFTSLNTICTDQVTEDKIENQTDELPQVSFHLTDFPLGSADISSVIINIQKIEVLNEDDEWITAADYLPNGLDFDLLQYQNGVTVEIGNFTLEPGTYKQLRMVILPEAFITENTVFGSNQIVATTPSESFQNIKILDHFETSHRNNLTMTVDFDAEQSLHYDVGNYIFTPNVRLRSLSSETNPVTLTPITIKAQDIQPNPPAGSEVTTTMNIDGLVALNSISIGSGTILNNNVWAVGVCMAAGSGNTCKEYDDDNESCGRRICLDGANEVSIGAGVQQPGGYMLLGNRISIGPSAQIGAVVNSNMNTIDVTANVPDLTTPVASVPALPDFLAGYKGHDNVTVLDTPLAEGIYKKLRLYDNETMYLSGGNYHFKKIKLGNNSSLICLEACQIYVRKRITTGDNAVIGSNIDSPNAFYIYIGRKGYTHGEHHHYHYETPENSSTGNYENDHYDNENHYDDDSSDDDNDSDDYDGDEIELCLAGPVYFSSGIGSQIKGHIYAPYGVVQFGDNNGYTGTLIAQKIILGNNNEITGQPPSLTVTEPFIAETYYNNNSLQLEFIDNSNFRMIHSSNPEYIYHGLYDYNLATKVITFNYQTVDLIDPNCLSCQATGVYPAIATYPVDNAEIPLGYWGFEVVSFSYTEINVRILADGELVTFTERSGFGPYDSIF